ncbi:MAG: GTPase HflX [Deltaproteobacteria bacterium]|nr:GTPase HflX [Deltaproteobacteria bacterium]
MRDISLKTNREIAILLSRDGRVIDIFIGKRKEDWISNLPPDLAPLKSFYSKRRIIRTSFFENISEKDILLLKKLRLDCLVVITVGERSNKTIAIVRTPPTSNEPIRFIEIDRNNPNSNFSSMIESFEEEVERYKSQTSPSYGETKAIVVGCGIESDTDIKFYMDELISLLGTLNIGVIKSIWQKRLPDSAYIIGKGKLSEIKELCEIYDCDRIVFFNTLSPLQKRNIEDETGLLILDRNQIILDIFAKRAKSNEGKIQVELAYLKYQLPRLNEKDAGLSRLVGGFKTKGPGETKLEVMRRRIKEKISLLNHRIEDLKRRRDFLREKRKISGIPRIAIVGYTNAGKSTLLNYITKSNVYVEDKLFATLDPTTRRYTFPDGFVVLFSDTVGFIKNLPEELKSAFMATFEEIGYADLILNVVDASSEDVHNHIEATEEILTELGFDHIPRLLIFNKIDKLNESIRIKRSDGIFISALTGEGIDILLNKVRELVI